MRRKDEPPIGPFARGRVTHGDCLALAGELPDASVDLVVSSPPYWGQRAGQGIGVEADPREYLERLTAVFTTLLPKLKPRGVAWINLGDAYNTPVNWRQDDRAYSTLGADRRGLGPRELGVHQAARAAAARSSTARSPGSPTATSWRCPTGW